MVRVQNLYRILVNLGAPALASEESACQAIVAARWPRGVIPCPCCGEACDRNLAQIRCRGRKHHRRTIFYATPLGTKLKPNARATLLALRAMCMVKRSVSARELARETGVDHVTLWRHMHSLRAVLPRLGFTIPISPIERETFRTWVNGTFHGIKACWHHRYWQERYARRFLGAGMLYGEVAKLVVGYLPITFELARKQAFPDDPHRKWQPRPSGVDETPLPS